MAVRTEWLAFILETICHLSTRLCVRNDSLIVKAFLLLLVLNPFQFQFSAPINAPLNIRAGIHNLLIKEVDVF